MLLAACKKEISVITAGKNCMDKWTFTIPLL